MLRLVDGELWLLWLLLTVELDNDDRDVLKLLTVELLNELSDDSVLALIELSVESELSVELLSELRELLSVDSVDSVLELSELSVDTLLLEIEDRLDMLVEEMDDTDDSVLTVELESVLSVLTVEELSVDSVELLSVDSEDSVLLLSDESELTVELLRLESELSVDSDDIEELESELNVESELNELAVELLRDDTVELEILLKLDNVVALMLLIVDNELTVDDDSVLAVELETLDSVELWLDSVELLRLDSVLAVLSEDAVELESELTVELDSELSELSELAVLELIEDSELSVLAVELDSVLVELLSVLCDDAELIDDIVELDSELNVLTLDNVDSVEELNVLSVLSVDADDDESDDNELAVLIVESELRLDTVLELLSVDVLADELLSELIELAELTVDTSVTDEAEDTSPPPPITPQSMQNSPRTVILLAISAGKQNSLRQYSTMVPLRQVMFVTSSQQTSSVCSLMTFSIEAAKLQPMIQRPSPPANVTENVSPLLVMIGASPCEDGTLDRVTNPVIVVPPEWSPSICFACSASSVVFAIVKNIASARFTLISLIPICVARKRNTVPSVTSNVANPARVSLYRCSLSM